MPLKTNQNPSTRAKLGTGRRALDFKLPDQNGETHKLSDYKGKWVLLYFYPKDDTPGCTKEACVIRDKFPDFKKLKIKVLGVSADSVKRHEKFADKYKLPFTLLSDESKSVIEKYGVWAKKKFMGREYMGILRTSFLINPNGKIAKIYENVKPEIHAQEVLEDVSNLSMS
jgi:peroxiredoxin Q/BCP